MTHPRRITAILLALVLLLAAAPSTAQSSATRAERERIRQAKAEQATTLEPLLAEDRELEAAVAAMQAEVDAQQAKADSARQAVEAAEAEIEALQARLVELRAQRTGLIEEARERAIAAYIGRDEDRFEQFVRSDDINEASRKDALLSTVQGSEADVLDQLRAVDEDLRLAEEETQTLATELRARKVAEDARLGELGDAKAELDRLEANLQARIDDVHGEITSLEAEEGRLTALLQRQLSDEAKAAAAAAAAAQIQSSSSRFPVAPAPSVVSARGLIYPVRGTLTSGFGPRWGRMHRGIDLAAPTGTPIYAAQSGTVLSAGWNSGGYGNAVIVDHGGGFATLYAHQSRIVASSGQSVDRGELIGYVGSTGNSTGPHLHFETRVNGVAYNPLSYL